MTTTPKIHAEMIKAWADGYDIEAFNPERGQWIVCPEPGWFADIEYRVRPGVIEAAKPAYDSYDVRVDQDPFDNDLLDLYNHLSNTEDYNLRLVFRDEKLVKAIVLKEEPTECGDLPW